MGIVLSDIMMNEYNAGSKARSDSEMILTEIGFKRHLVFNRNHCNALKAIELILSMQSLFIKAQRNEVIILQYPYNMTILKMLSKQFQYLKEKRQCFIVYLIHDIYYIRGDQSLDIHTLKKSEMKILNTADALIVHNDNMKKKLSDDGIVIPMQPLKVFDYLSSEIDDRERKGKTGITVDFAGNLSREKSGFLYKIMDTPVRINLYGKKEIKIPEQFTYRGSFAPEALPAVMDGDYGLVWDGDSSDTCTGNYGEYLKYNNPHKASLYIVAEKPLIVWRESAIADYINEKGIGVSIASLKELENLPSVDSHEYHTMKNNVRILARELRAGNMLKRAIWELMKK